MIASSASCASYGCSEGWALQHPPDLQERMTRIEGKMTTHEEVNEFRALVGRREMTARWLPGRPSTAIILAGFLTLLLTSTR